jgi:hypothetical protein
MNLVIAPLSCDRHDSQQARGLAPEAAPFESEDRKAQLVVVVGAIRSRAICGARSDGDRSVVAPSLRGADPVPGDVPQPKAHHVPPYQPYRRR